MTTCAKRESSSAHHVFLGVNPLSILTRDHSHSVRAFLEELHEWHAGSTLSSDPRPPREMART